MDTIWIYGKSPCPLQWELLMQLDREILNGELLSPGIILDSFQSVHKISGLVNSN